MNTFNSTQSVKKVQYKVHNWSEYNKSLIQRGALTLWMSDDISDWWYVDGRYTYSDRAIEFMLTIKAIYHLPLRATIGFIRSLFASAGIMLEVPDYTTISRRAETIDVRLQKKRKTITNIIVDSTGVKIYGEGEWKVRKHGWNYRRTWRKIHVGIDGTGEIRAVSVTHSDTHDIVPIKQLLNQELGWITDFYADGAYDSNQLYMHLSERGVIGIHIPPQHNAKILPKSHSKRNQAIREIRQTDRDTWKQNSGYHTRSLVETTMFRYKTIFGDRLSFRKQSSQTAEIITKCNILNTFHYLCEVDSRAVVL